MRRRHRVWGALPLVFILRAAPAACIPQCRRARMIGPGPRRRSFCASRGLPPDVIKIDVEGAELEVLRGGRDTAVLAGCRGVRRVPSRRLGFPRSRAADIERELTRNGFIAEPIDPAFDLWKTEGILRSRPVHGDAHPSRQRIESGRRRRRDLSRRLGWPASWRAVTPSRACTTARTRSGDPRRIPVEPAWSIESRGLDDRSHRRGLATRRLLLAQHAASTSTNGSLREWPIVKMMHGYFGTCVSGQKAFCFPGASLHAALRPRVSGALPAAALRPSQSHPMTRQYAGPRGSGSCFRATPRSSSPASTCGESTWRTAFGGSRRRDSAVPRRRGRAASRRSSIDVLFLGRLTPLKGGEALIRARIARQRHPAGR